MTRKPKEFNPSGLGRAIINQKSKDAKDAKQQRELRSNNINISHSSSAVRLKSVTQERCLDEFLNAAQLAGTEFTAVRRNVKIISQNSHASENPYLLTKQEELDTLKKHTEHRNRLRVPRRPLWTRSMTSEELDKHERMSFLEWRRGLAQLQDEEGFILTPFERNLEVWRQLWRVLERSHLVVQVVDARNPLRFRCEDLEAYVKDIDGIENDAGCKNSKKSLLLINKADLLTPTQRSLWSKYFALEGINFAFFSATIAATSQHPKGDTTIDSPELQAFCSGSEDEREDETGWNYSFDSSLQHEYHTAEDFQNAARETKSHILSVAELKEWFLEMAPDLSGIKPAKLTVGLVGYPNVGKSSTINTLLGEKKVSVSSTPGKTRHFQTIYLSDNTVLCDCPGLVFPQFATAKADLVCDGVLPIDQLREHTGPTSLLVKRIPREVLEATYNLSIPVHEGTCGDFNAHDFLITYAATRGFMRSGKGTPDEARAARYVLKDYVSGKLLFCHPPPGILDHTFNKRTHQISLLRSIVGKRARLAQDPHEATDSTVPQIQGPTSRAVDQEFFEKSGLASARPFVQGTAFHGQEHSRVVLFQHQSRLANDGTLQKQTARTIGERDKRHRKPKRIKQRSGSGYD